MHNTTILHIHHILGILPKHSTTNRQTDSGRTLHMKTVGFGKGMCEETEERGYTNKTYQQFFVIVVVSCSNHTIVPSTNLQLKLASLQ